MLRSTSDFVSVLAAPTSWPINIYIYICIQNEKRRRAGGGADEGEPPPLPPPNTLRPPQENCRDSKCSETVFGCHQTCSPPGGAGGPGRGGQRGATPPTAAGWDRAHLDERDPHGDARGFGPLRRVLADEVLHHGVFGHVLHQVRLLRGRRTDGEQGVGVLEGLRRAVPPKPLTEV